MSVYLAEPNPRYDLSALQPYGEIKTVSDRPLNPFDITTCFEELSSGLRNFDPTEDYICLTGRVQTVAYLLAIAHNKYPIIRVLLFDATTSNYRERIFTNEFTH